MHEKILILDFGSQVTQLIARRIREMNVLSEIIPATRFNQIEDHVKGIIFSGSPCSIHQSDAPFVDLSLVKDKLPVLGICYGAQMIAHLNGGEVARSTHREYGRANLSSIQHKSPLMKGISLNSQVWMSHGDTILNCGKNADTIASTSDVVNAAFEIHPHRMYGVQFHPEVYHTTEGLELLRNFVVDICGCRADWTPGSFVDESLDRLRKQLGNDEVIMALSGGVDSTVAAVLIHRAIGNRLHCVFVDNGLLRKNEFEEVLKNYHHMDLDITGVDASDDFYHSLKGLTDPEQKRKAVGKTFIDVFESVLKKFPAARWLGQGTIYPDVIESLSPNGGVSQTIKSHHNVGGLPERMKLQVVEPIRMLFKDEVRRIGRSIGISEDILSRHPFPGPGLSIRILGEVTPEWVRILQEADHIWTAGLKRHNLYQEVWQAGAILLPVKSVGVMGDERTYERTIALRAVSSTDGMTADWSRLPMEFLAEISSKIINEVKGVNRVVYDISSKPPATIEWE
jgi:GMP synthase (glutamine-hydrolysing)